MLPPATQPHSCTTHCCSGNTGDQLVWHSRGKTQQCQRWLACLECSALSVRTAQHVRHGMVKCCCVCFKGGSPGSFCFTGPGHQRESSSLLPTTVCGVCQALPYFIAKWQHVLIVALCCVGCCRLQLHSRHASSVHAEACYSPTCFAAVLQKVDRMLNVNWLQKADQLQLRPLHFQVGSTADCCVSQPYASQFRA
jgi:hypothetical protein